MFSADNLNVLFREVMARISGQGELKNGCNKDNCMNTCNQNAQNNKSNHQKHDSGSKISINPSQALAIAGILAGVLDVYSVLVDKDQEVQIVLIGSLKQKTQLEKMMDQIGSMPFDDVLRALMDRLV